MTIDGAGVAGSETFGVSDPATQTECGRAPLCSAADLDTAVEAASRAFGAWESDEVARRQALTRMADRLDGTAQELGELLCAEQGRPLSGAIGEVLGCAAWLRHYSTLPLPVDHHPEALPAGVSVSRRPMGVVAAITPWNFPLLLAIWKVGPALLAGNTVVVKPSPSTPLSTLRMGELVRDLLPPGVLNVVSGDDSVGERLVTHPLVRKVAFTGSVRAGRTVAQAAAVDLKRVTLELGGNDAAIVLEDADPESIAPALFWAAFTNAGQVCAAIKRVYVPRSRLADLAEALSTVAAGVKLGPGSDPASTMGPLTTRQQFDHISELVADAVRRGARATVGGTALEGPGNFFPPTILVDVPSDSRIVVEEQFGPALPLIAYDALDDAVEQANQSRFGLAGSVWAADVDAARQVADRLQCGTAYVNSHGDVWPSVPFGGTKDSGLGAENGTAGLESYLDIRVTAVRSAQGRPVPESPADTTPGEPCAGH